jgi:hypothetical protein
MKLIFFDESKDDAAYPHYHLAGICLDDSSLLAVEGEVNHLATDCFGTSELSRDTEFHAAEIFHRKRNFKGWANFGDRVTLLGKFVDILSREDIDLIDVQINCNLLHQGEPPRLSRRLQPERGWGLWDRSDFRRKYGSERCGW